jgi:hypothetical protein
VERTEGFYFSLQGMLTSVINLTDGIRRGGAERNHYKRPSSPKLRQFYKSDLTHYYNNVPRVAFSNFEPE